MEELKQENRRLQALIQGLEYENKMYKSLLDNLFLHQSQSFNVGTQKNALNQQKFDPVQPHPPSAPGTEIFNVFTDHHEDFDCDENEEYAEHEQHHRKKDFQAVEEEEPIVEDKQLVIQEMQNLYGEKGAKSILAMETAMQLNFEKVKDTQKCQIWPCLPLNMKFE